MNNTELLNFVVLFACFFSTFMVLCSIGLSLHCMIEVKSLKKSTHSIQYMPLDPQWSSSDKEINEFNENNKVLDDNDDPEMDIHDLNKIDLDKMI